MYEEAFFHLLNTLHGRYGLDSLALAGGARAQLRFIHDIFHQTSLRLNRISFARKQRRNFIVAELRTPIGVIHDNAVGPGHLAA